MTALLMLIPAVGLICASWNVGKSQNIFEQHLTEKHATTMARKPIPDKWREDKYQALSPEEKIAHGGR